MGWLVERDVDGQCIALRHEGEGGLEAARKIRAGRVEVEDEPFRGGGQLGIAGRRGAQGLAENGLTEHQGMQIEILHLHFHGKVGQDRLVRLLGGLVGALDRLIGRQRLSPDLERADFEMVDL
jgi:hypothetical protein